MSVSTRTLAGAVAAMIIFDTLWVRAPFLGFLAVPFIIAAWRYRDGRTSTRVVLGLWCALYVVIGVTFAVSNGLHAPAEPTDVGPRETISVGDFVAIYLATPVAAWLGLRLFAGLRRSARVSRAALSAHAS